MEIKPESEVISYKRVSQKISEIAGKPRNRTYSMLIFSLVAITLLAWFAIRPTIRTILQLEREIADKSELNKRMDAKISSLIQAQEDYNNLQPRLAVLSQAVPNKPEVMKYLSALKKVEEQSQLKTLNLNLSNVSLATDSAQPPALNEDEENPASPGSALSQPAELQKFPVIISLTGPYENLHAYLEALASMRRITTVTTLDIKSESSTEVRTSSGSGKLLNILLQVVTYFQGDPD